MKRRTTSIVAVSLLSALLIVVSQIRGVNADVRVASLPCSEGTLIGSYGFYGTGTTSDGPYASVGTLNFDGKGNCTRRQSVSNNGAFYTNHLTFQYTVAHGCTGKALYNGGEFETFVIADGGNEIYLLKESAQTTYLVAKKIHP